MTVNQLNCHMEEDLKENIRK